MHRQGRAIVVLVVGMTLLGCTSEEPRNSVSSTASSTASSTPSSSATSEPVDADRVVRNLDWLFGSDALYPTVMSVLVSQNGKLVVERYYANDATDSHDIASVTKSFLSTLVGIAVDDEPLRLDQRLGDLLPDYASRMSTAGRGRSCGSPRRRRPPATRPG